MSNINEITNDLSRAKNFFENIISFTIGPFTLEDMIKHRIDSMNIVDVRDYEEYIDGHIPYAVHIPHKDINEHAQMLEKSKVTVIYSYNDICEKAYKCALTLIEQNYPCVILRGGFKAWKKFDLDIIKSSSDD